MVIRRNSITERIKELDTIVQELAQYQATTLAKLESDLSRRWIIERGLIAAASLVLDIADHILTEEFSIYTATYEASLKALQEHQVISDLLYHQIKGLGGFRNVLVHLYQEIDLEQVLTSHHKALIVFPKFAQEIFLWLDSLDKRQD